MICFSISTIFGDSIKPEPKENPPELCRYGTNNRGGGDHSEVILQPNSLMENNFKELSMQPLKTEKG